MNPMKPALAITFTLVAITYLLEIAQAQLSPSIKVVSGHGIPPVTDRPSPRHPAGTRGECEMTEIPFTPLLPVIKSSTKFEFSGFTLTGHPTIWFYVPYKTDKVRSGYFSLSLESQPNNKLYETDVKLPETPGFVSISLPITVNPLENNQLYRWEFGIICESNDPNDQSLSVAHTGTVKRVNLPDIESQLKRATLTERLNLYVKNKIWYDASTDLAKIHDSPQTWLKLLEAIDSDLKPLAKVPIAGSAVPIAESKLPEEGSAFPSFIGKPEP
jgi:hypothetical protein